MTGSRVLQVVDLVSTLMGEHGLTDRGWVFTLDNSVSRAGCCHHTDKAISLSKHLVYGEAHDLGLVRNTLLHEIAHALAGPGLAHGVRWREIAVRIGCDGLRCHDMELRPWSKALVCVQCGFTNAFRHRVSREFWRTATCRSCAASGGITTLSRETWEAINDAKGDFRDHDHDHEQTPPTTPPPPTTAI